jgi:hypothetical protein
MRYIATTAAADAHFFEHRFAPLKNRNPTSRHCRSTSNGRKKTGSPSTNNCDVHRSHNYVYIWCKGSPQIAHFFAYMQASVFSSVLFSIFAFR